MEDITQSAHSFTSLIPLLIIFAIAGIFVPLFQRLKLSPVLGYLICGVIVGPYGVALFVDQIPLLSKFIISDISTVSLIGEIGIIFLMFMIGLELSFRRLMEMRNLVLGLGSLQIIINAIAIALIVLLFDNSPIVSILVGISFSLSSTAIVMQLLDEQHQNNRPVGKISFSILLMQDLAVVPLLVIIGAMSLADSDTSLPLVLLKSMLIAVAVVGIIYVVGTKLLRPLLGILSISKSPEWLLSLAIFLAIGIATITHSAGLSAALGAFLAGLLIAETDFRHEIEVMINPVKSLLLGVFFLSVGMMMDLRAIENHPFWIPASVIGLFVIKTICTFLATLPFKIKRSKAIEASVRLAQAGEFAFLILGLAVAGGIIPKEDQQFFLLVASLSMFCTPFFTKLAPTIIKLFPAGANAEYQSVSPEKDLSDSPKVLIAGYGRVGRLLGATLEARMVPYVAIENNFDKVKKLREQGHRVVFADSRKIDIWRHLNLDSVKVIVIAIDNPESSEMILKALRTEWPLIPIIARTHDTEHMEHLYALGATSAIPEILEASMKIATEILETIGIDEYDIECEIERSRQNAMLQHTDTQGT
jgi:CPA2 family monovalent cation:H+ antiporter-2